MFAPQYKLAIPTLMKSGITTTRPVQPGDASFLYQVFVSSREEEFSLLDWPQDKIDVLMRSQYDLQTKGYGATFPAANHLVILFNGEPVGRILVNENQSEIRIVDIAILTSLRRRGIGRTVVHGLMETAEKSRKPLRHRVYHGELNAIRFYFALGYRVIEDEGAAFHMEWTPASMKSEIQAGGSGA